MSVSIWFQLWSTRLGLVATNSIRVNKVSSLKWAPTKKRSLRPTKQRLLHRNQLTRILRKSRKFNSYLSQKRLKIIQYWIQPNYLSFHQLKKRLYLKFYWYLKSRLILFLSQLAADMFLNKFLIGLDYKLTHQNQNLMIIRSRRIRIKSNF